MPGAEEHSHMDHPDFRAGGRVFATLGYPDEEWGMVKLSPEEQNNFVQAEPLAFVPVRGAWGLRGCTSVRLQKAKSISVRRALQIAWSVATVRKPPISGRSASKSRF